MADFWKTSPQPYADLDGESRKFFLHPWLRDEIQRLKPRNILDFGSGDGSLFANCAAAYTSVWFYDHSKPMLDLARQAFQHNDNVHFLSTLDGVPEQHFDMVVSSLVLMTIATEDELRAVVASMFRVASSKASCLLAVTHPCFRQYPFSTFRTEFNDKQFVYMTEGTPFRVKLFDSSHRQSVEFTDFHWTLSTTINLFLQEGFLLRRVVELPDRSQTQSDGNLCFPAYLVLHYVKP